MGKAVTSQQTKKETKQRVCSKRKGDIQRTKMIKKKNMNSKTKTKSRSKEIKNKISHRNPAFPRTLHYQTLTQYSLVFC